MKKSRPSQPAVSPPPALLIVISGPSGVGKDAILSCLRQSGFPLHTVTTVTTRPRRQAERDGLDYHFVSPDRFQEMIRQQELLEWAVVYGNRYGVPRAPVREALSQGRDVVIKIDVQGAATIKQSVPEAVFIFVAPPTLEDLGVRLQFRKTESAEALRLRLETATAEMERLPMFDYVVVNEQDNLQRAVEDIKSIVRAEKCRVSPRKTTL